MHDNVLFYSVLLLLYQLENHSESDSTDILCVIIIVVAV